ncbi:MAG: choloylglycine hydrolase [Erysipelotrichaceae bacterium]
MCTAFTLASKDNQHFFGRNMDLEYDFNQSVMMIPRNYKWENVVDQSKHMTSYAMIGMGTILFDHPMIAEAMNEKGLAVAGLNFPHYCGYEQEVIEGDVNIGPFDVALWILSHFESVNQLKETLETLHIIDRPFNQHVPNATLHWIVSDKENQSIVIECVEGKMNVHDNPLGLLGNSPTFDWHMTHLNQYTMLNVQHQKPVQWLNHTLTPDGQGTGLIGLPGDVYPASRFVRAAFLKTHSQHIENAPQTIAQVFHILGNLAMVAGSVITEDDKQDLTRYSSCMWLETGVYYYWTYETIGVHAIALHNQDLEAHEIKLFEYPKGLKIYHQNQ